MSTVTKFTITITRESAKHAAIAQYIERHCDHDGRGIRTQPLIEKLFYEFARSGLTPDEVCYAIRAYEASMDRNSGAENGGGLHHGTPMKIAESPPPAASEMPATPVRPSQNLKVKPKPDAQEKTEKTIPAKPRDSDDHLPDIETEGLIEEIMELKMKPKDGDA